MDIGADRGVVVIEIVPDSPADKAGLRLQDVITQIDGEPIDSMTNLRKLLYNYRIGDNATLTINRNGNESKVNIRFFEFQ